MGGGGWSNFDPTSSHFLGGYGQYTPWSTRYYTHGGWQGPSGGGGGKGGKGQQPTPPDFQAAANAQGEQSLALTREQTRANRPNQYSPFGYSKWSQDANGNWTQRTGLSPELDSAVRGLGGQIASQAGQPIMTGDQARQQAIDAAYGQATSRLDPMWQQRESQFATQLANEGLTRGDSSWRQAMADMGRQRTDAYNQAMYGAIGQGTEAGNAVFAQNLAARNAPYQQLSQLRGMSTIQPFTPAGISDPAQTLAAQMQQYNAALGQYGINQAQKNSKMQGAAGLGAAAITKSDERLKLNIQRLEGEAIPGVKWATWDWRDGSGAGFGVIAQDLRMVRPDLVHEQDGVLMVDYVGLAADARER